MTSSSATIYKPSSLKVFDEFPNFTWHRKISILHYLFLNLGFTQTRSDDVRVQISPFRIILFYQCKLPYTFPFLQPLLHHDGTLHRFMNFIPNQCMYAIMLRESFYQIIFVLPDSLDKIRGNASVQGSVAFARHDIYAGLVHLLIPLDYWINYKQYRRIQRQKASGNGLSPLLTPQGTDKTFWIAAQIHTAMTTYTSGSRLKYIPR